MHISLTIRQLTEHGFTYESAQAFLQQLEQLLKHCDTNEEAWHVISKNLLTNQLSFDLHLLLFTTLFPDWHNHPETAPAWIPTPEIMESANITRFMREIQMPDLKSLKQWIANNKQCFWEKMLTQLNIVFDQKPKNIADFSQGVESPRWLPGAALNITNSCFNADPSRTAIIYQDQHQNIQYIAFGELNELTNRIANSLVKSGFVVGDAIGIAMPMNHFAIAIYLGIIKMGGVVVSIPDSFSSDEITTRLNIAKAKAIFTQDYISWAGKQLPLYEKVKHACDTAENPLAIIVTACEKTTSIPLRDNDISWDKFLVENTSFKPIALDPMAPCNILFSSGTTGAPKAIVWNHTTAIKAASDAFFHQNIQPGDILAWPTNLGWMMGPWLIYAALINQSSIAVCAGAPKDRIFGEFIQDAKVTMLGVVPTLVAAWRQSKCMEGLDWHTIKVFSSTGECSNAADMLYLMALAGYKPVIEYCGGTEIGGAYLTSTVIQNNHPSLFTTPAMGLDIVLLDDTGKPTLMGEIAIIPPSMGLSTTLLNADHHQVYFAEMPRLANGEILRRHGDLIKQYANGYYSILGRVDDTMKLGGIKISAAEIERTITGIDSIIEVAAIAIPPVSHGPSLLVIYASTTAKLDKPTIMKQMQKMINSDLNPLFKIHDVVFTTELPKTASNKIMRRILRSQYQSLQEGSPSP